MLVFKLEIDISENEKLNLNLNSMIWKKDKENDYDFLLSKKVREQL